MPRTSDEVLGYPELKPALPDFFKELARDGARWADAELALTRAEAGTLLRRYMAGLAMVSVAFAAAIAAAVILAQAGVMALLPYVGGQISANVIVGFMLVGLVALLALTARYLFTRKTPPLSMFFRWLAGSASSDRNSK